jgi:hypothetical protein
MSIRPYRKLFQSGKNLHFGLCKLTFATITLVTLMALQYDLI